MTEDTKDVLAFWGLAIMGLTALAGLELKFGPTGLGVGVLLFILPAHRAVVWMEDARRLRLQEEPSDS